MPYARKIAVACCSACLAVCLFLSGCANELLVEARVQQTVASSPKIAVIAAGGRFLASGGDLSFGAVSAGGSLGSAIRIINEGVAALSIGSSALVATPVQGTEAGVFTVSGTTPLEIQSGESADFNIVFSPTEAKDYGAVLSIVSNDVSTPTFTLALSGSGSSTAKELTGFSIQSPAATGSIDEAGKAVSLALPSGTSLTSLVAVFSSTGAKVMVGSVAQTSGYSTNDFTSPVTYSVYAEDGSKADYLVTAAAAPGVVTGSVSSIATTTAIGGGTVAGSGSASVVDSGLCWSISQNPTVADAHVSSGMTSGSFSCSMTGLSAGTTYYVRAYATSSAGTGYGAQVSFSTLSESMPSATTASASSVTVSSAICGGTITSAGTSSVTDSGLCWSISPNPTTADAHVSSGMTSGSFSCSMTGLAAGTTYYARAYATSSVGTGYGDQVSFSTLSESVPSATTASVSSVTVSSASCGGTITGAGTSSVTDSGLCWSTSQNPTISGSHASSGMTSGSFSGSMTGLAAGTTYYARAYATNSVGTGYGDQISFITLPSATTISSAGPIGGPSGSGKMSVVWASVAGAQTYDVYSSTTNSIPALPTSGGTDVAGTSCTLVGLTNYTTYYVWVVAKNASGKGAPSASRTGSVGIAVTGISVAASPSDAKVPRDGILNISAATIPSTATDQSFTWSLSDTANFTLYQAGSSATISTTSTTPRTATVTAATGYGSFSGNVSISSTVPRSSLRGEWLFTDGSLSDTSGNNSGATSGGWSALASGHLGDASSAFLKTPASAAYSLRLGSSFAFSSGDSFSVSLWAKTDALPGVGYYAPIIGQFENSTGCFHWDLHLASSGVRAMAGKQGSSRFFASSALSTGTWHHIAMTYNGSNVTLYVDGTIQESTSVVGITAGAPSASYLPIGALPTGYPLLTSGLGFTVDDVRLYGRVLTAAEVLSLKNY